MRTHTRNFIVTLIAVCLMVVVGCVQNPPTGPGTTPGGDNTTGAGGGPIRPIEPVVATIIQPSPSVDHIELEASPPSAVNLDSEPGPDGVSLKMRLYNLKDTQAFTLNQGEIEVLLFEGNIKERELIAAQPLITWKMGASQLRPYAVKTAVGPQYVITLTWLDRIPETSTITVVARIPRPNAPALYARRVVLTTGPR